MIYQRNQEAVYIKILALTHGAYGYKKNLLAAFSLNEYWVEQGSKRAIERKVEGFALGIYGYRRDRGAAVDLNECLIKQDSGKAIRRKIKGLVSGCYGYDKNVEAAFEFNEQLVVQGNEEGIIGKITDLSKKQDIDKEDFPFYDDISLYHPDPTKLKNWIEEEISKGTRWACYLKAKGLKYGILGFEKDQEVAIAYIKKYNIPY